MMRSWVSRLGPSAVALSALLLVTALLRVVALPARYDLRDVDEPDYLQGGLLLLEGLPPSYHYAPAGPQSWVSWAYAGVQSARYFLAPTAEELRVPAQVRVYTAINHALFDIYHDMSGLRYAYVAVAVVVSLCAVAAAYRLGLRWGGMAGALLCGGLVAFVPLLTDFAVTGRPYSVAWSCAVISVYFAAVRPGTKGAVWAGVFAGLSVASRIEMLMLLPLPVAALGPGRPAFRAFLKDAVRLCLAAAVTALLVAPWLVTNLLGNLRAIATIRFGPPPSGPVTVGQTLADFGWQQGLALAAVLFLVAFAASLRRWREPGGGWRVLFGLYVFLLLLPMFRATGYGMRHQGPSILALLVAVPFAGALVVGRWRRAGWAVVGAALLLPAAQSVRLSIERRRGYAPDEAVAWVNARVPPGTVLYVNPTLRDPLPTTQSADAMWDQVMARQGAVEKFKSALARFQLDDGAEMPRALSEQHMVVERSRVRRWFILGSRAGLAGPRFDVRRYGNSGVAAFSPQDPVPDFQKTGGALIWRGPPLPPSLVGEPVVSWVNADGAGTRIYCSPDVRQRLRTAD